MEEYRAILHYDIPDDIFREDFADEMLDRYMDEVSAWGPAVSVSESEGDVIVSFEAEDLLSALDTLRTRLPHGHPLPVGVEIQIAEEEAVPA
jgi:hypothetical protein